MVDQTYKVTDPNKEDYKHDAFTISPDYCPFTYAYGATNLASGESGLTRAGDTHSFFYADFAAIGQTQVVTITATSTSIYGTNNAPITASDTFDVNYESPCQDHILTTLTATAQATGPSDNYSDTLKTWSYNDFTVDP